MLKIKNWKRFQHFTDRKPPWVKLYRDLLDDIKWHELDSDSAKHLVMMWLIASEMNGELPSIKELAFRLRTTEKLMKSTVSKLAHWLVQDDINVISDANLISERCQDDINAIPLARSQETETEKEKEKETETEESVFQIFYSAYPKKVGKPAALKAWKSQHINGDLQKILADVGARASSDDWTKENRKYCPHPATYINQRRWEDQLDGPSQPTDPATIEGSREWLQIQADKLGIARWDGMSQFQHYSDKIFAAMKAKP